MIKAGARAANKRAPRAFLMEKGGLANCTFDDNDYGVRFNDYDNLTMMDCLFTSNDYGASRYHNYVGGNFDHDYNGFYNNIHDLYDEQTQQDIDLGDYAKQLEESPYDPHAAYGERFYFIQHDNDLIDGGSRTAGAAAMSSYTTSLGSLADRDEVDIGYHYPLRLKPYLQKLGTDKMTVMWHGDAKKMGYIEWGLTENYGHLESDGPSQLGSIWIYEKELSGLEANTLYHYRVRHGTEYSPDCTFRTAMSTGDSFRFIAYGDNRGNDSGLREEHLKVVNCMLAHAWRGGEPRFALHCGDFVNKGDTLGQWQPHFFDPAAGLLRSTPLWPSIGNHEYKDDHSPQEYIKLFSVPKVTEESEERWYSFDYASCHFIVLDTGEDADEEYIYDGGESKQYKWLLDDISSPEADNADWVIVLLHIPPYTDSSAHPYGSEQQPNDVYRIRTYLAPIFEDPDHPADLVICGHNHFYEHSQAGEGEEPEHWVHYIVTGGGGADLHTPGPNNPERVWADRSRHFCVIDIDGTTATLNAIRENGTEVEEVELHPGQMWE